MRKSLLLLVAVLIALPSANAIAQPGPRLNAAIVKCIEDNNPASTTGITVFKTDATFTLPDTCDPGDTCALCLRDLARDFNCRGGSVFGSNVEVTQQSDPAVVGSQSINKYVFACEGPQQ